MNILLGTKTCMGMKRRLRSQVCVGVLVGCASVGCESKSPPPTSPTPAATTQIEAEADREIPFAEQIELIRAGDATSIDVSAGEITDDQLASIGELKSLDTIIIDAGKITDAGLKALPDLPALTSVRLRASPVSDEGFATLAKCAALRAINIPQAECTAAGIAALKPLEQLRSLRIGSAKLTSHETVEAIKSLPHLRSLHLINVPLEDADLELLAGHAALQSLYLDGSHCTDDGWSKFFKLRPDVHVHVDQAHHDLDPLRH